MSSDGNEEMEAIVIVFGKENNSRVDWNKERGRGLNVINLVGEKTKLTFCEDEVANLRGRLRLSLSEKCFA